MKPLIAALALALVLLVPFSVGARQTGQRVPVAPSNSSGLASAGGSVPSGYMIVGSTEVAPRGYTYTGLSFIAESDSSEWLGMPSLSVARTELQAVVVGGTIYALGGLDGGYSGAVEAFDPAVGTWDMRAPMPTARTRLAAVVVNEKIYAIGGFNGNDLDTVEEYTPATDTWRSCSPMPTARMMHAAAQVNGRIYAIGGSHDGLVSLATVEEYDPSSDTWTSKQPIPTARGKCAVVAIDDKIFVLGGYNTPLPVEVYDPTTNQWSARLPGPAVYDWAAVTTNGRVFTLGGYSNGSAVYEYMPSTDEWRSRTPMPTPRQSLAAVDLGDMVYAIGGNVYGPAVATVEGYRPDPPVFLHRKD